MPKSDKPMDEAGERAWEECSRGMRLALAIALAYGAWTALPYVVG